MASRSRILIGDLPRGHTPCDIPWNCTRSVRFFPHRGDRGHGRNGGESARGAEQGLGSVVPCEKAPSSAISFLSGRLGINARGRQRSVAVARLARLVARLAPTRHGQTLRRNFPRQPLSLARRAGRLGQTGPQTGTTTLRTHAAMHTLTDDSSHPYRDAPSHEHIRARGCQQHDAGCSSHHGAMHSRTHAEHVLALPSGKACPSRLFCPSHCSASA